MNVKFKLLGVLLAVSCGAASAGQIFIGGQNAGAAGKITARPGVCTVTFDSGTAANTCGAVYTTSAPGTNYVTGSVPGRYAAPVGDTTGYMTVGPTDGSPVTVNLGAVSYNYFGFYAGSLDTFNLVQFFFGATMVDSFTGSQINAVAFPGQATDGDQGDAQFIDYFPTSAYNRVVFSSGANAFETDSHAFGIAAIPEPTSVALLGLGALALVARRRKSKAD